MLWSKKMDLPWGSPENEHWITNVGLITSDGPFGPNVMACEWTHMVSYEPCLIAICVNRRAATHVNITASKEFGVSLASTSQTALSSLAGGSTGKAIHKIKALEEIGHLFYSAKKIKAPMVQKASLNVECKLVQTIELGDHTMFVGEVLAVQKTSHAPLALHGGKYWKMNESLPKVTEEERARHKEILHQYKKQI